MDSNALFILPCKHVQCMQVMNNICIYIIWGAHTTKLLCSKIVSWALFFRTLEVVFIYSLTGSDIISGLMTSSDQCQNFPAQHLYLFWIQNFKLVGRIYDLSMKILIHIACGVKSTSAYVLRHPHYVASFIITRHNQDMINIGTCLY